MVHASDDDAKDLEAEQPPDAVDRDLASIRDEVERDAASSAPVALSPAEVQRRKLRAGILGGVAAMLAAFLALPYIAALPAGILILDAGLICGWVSLTRWLTKGNDITDAEIAALVPWLAIPRGLTLLLQTEGLVVPLGLFTLAGPVMALAVASALLWGLPRGSTALSVGLLGGGLAVGVLGWALTSLAAPPGTWVTVLTTIVAVALALAVQCVFRRAVGRFSALASPAALAMAGAQLLDGVVSYLAVRNPFGWLDDAHTEQVALSAFLLRWTGPGFIAAKWLLAILVAFALQDPRGRSRVDDPLHRALLVLAVAYIGLGPGLYSLIGLFAD